jgi:hypothetical protein
MRHLSIDETIGSEKSFRPDLFLSGRCLDLVNLPLPALRKNRTAPPPWLRSAKIHSRALSNAARRSSRCLARLASGQVRVTVARHDTEVRLAKTGNRRMALRPRTPERGRDEFESREQVRRGALQSEIGS